ncbi:DUF4365 domain-containing protein [Scytonema sp. NUACC26]|uniref:DUF4365 domain-containing protein n=1 Tax=Scytonema sp. NUACC26 TaxID=3140176 RepID=UPI0038B36829
MARIHSPTHCHRTRYWEYLSGNLSENRQSVRIRISRSQRLTPESLLTLIERVKTGEW